ncbi:hypothetical protein [Clostridium sp. DJ247]|uniref:phage tail protein n=1 Tax=Clostridium sp. DJ247 TaxID=2726188 RepID=UPI0016278DBE|nr:hypothetical protein [Clostridium sp. DJ247]MBC2579691.1 hypothetical protein [Clostridium sp. DJ247]
MATKKDDMSASMLSIIESMNKISEQATKTSKDIEKIVQITSNSSNGSFFENLVTEGKKADDAISKTFGNTKEKILSTKDSIEKVLKGKAYNLTIGNAANLEQYETSFIALTGNSDKAKAKLKELSDYYRTTPFEFPGVVNAAKTLMTSGLDTTQYLKDIGNLAEGTNQPIEKVAESFGKIGTGNFADAFKSLNEFGIDNKVLEAKGLVFDKDGSYKGSAEKALSAVQQITKEKYGKITDIHGQTFNGLTATLKNSFNAMGTDIGQKALPQVKTALSSLIVSMDKISKSGTFDRLGNMAGAAIGKIAVNIPKVLNLIDKLGTFVVKNWNIIQPILVGLGTAIISLKVLSQIDKAITKIKELQEIAEGLKGLAGAGKIFENIFGFGPQGLIIIAVITAIAIAAFLIIKYWGPISGFFKKLWADIIASFNNIKANTINTWNSISNSIRSIIGGLRNGIQAAVSGLKAVFVTVFNSVRTATMAILNPFIKGITNIFKHMQQGIGNVMKGFKSVFIGIWNATLRPVLGIVAAILYAITGNFGKSKTMILKSFQSIRTGLNQIWQGIRLIFTGYIQAIVGFIRGAFENAKNNIILVWKYVSNVLAALWSGIKSTCSSVWSGILSFFAALPARFITFATSIMNGLRNGIINGLSTVSSALHSGFENAISFISNLPSKFFEWGKDMLHNLANGITSAIGVVGGAIEGVAEKIRKFIHFTKPDIGPLADFDTYGPDMMKLFGTGIKTNINHVIDPVKDVAVGVKTNLKNGIDAEPLSLGKVSSVNTTKNESKASILINIAKLAEQLVVREDSDIDKIADALANRLEKVSFSRA